MAFAGIRGTGKFGTDERPKNFRELILFAEPNGRSPIFALSSKMRKQSTDDAEIAWWEETLTNVRVRLNDGTDMSVVDTAVVVDSGALQLVLGDILQVEITAGEAAVYAEELVRVTAVASDTAFTITRAFAGTTAAIILNDSYFTRVGTSFEEGSAKATISQRNPTKKVNYCQIFKTAVGMTNTVGKTKTRTGDAWANDKKRKAFDHAANIEWALMFGVASEITSGSHPQRSMGGLREFLTTNTKIYSTAVVEANLLDDIYKVFDFESGGAGTERIAFCGNTALNVINKLAKDSASTRLNFAAPGTIDMFGMDVQKLVLPQGTLALRSHPLMNVHPRYTSSIFIINPAGIIYRPLRDTFFEDNIQTPGTDSREAQWLSEISFEVQHEETMAYLGNLA